MGRAHRIAVAFVLAAACTPKSSSKPDLLSIVDAGVTVDASVPDASAPEIVDAASPVIVPRKPTTVKAWLRGQGVTVKTLGPLAVVDSCVMAGVGDPSEAALLCESHTMAERGTPPNDAYRVVFHRGMFVVRNGAIVTVLDAVERIAILDPEDESGELLDLTLDVAANGMTATIADDPKASCKAAVAGLKTESELPSWRTLDADLFAKACSARGHYRWQNGSFVKDP